MQIRVRLHGILRDQLPIEARGRATVELPEGATVGNLIDHFGIRRTVEAAVNDEHEADRDHPLRDGDEVHIFTVIGGG